MANSAEEKEMGTEMVGTLVNLANAAVQRNDTFEQLVKTNQTLTNTVSSQQAEIKRLLTIVTALSSGKQPQQQSNGGEGETSDVWDPNGYCWWHGFKVKHSHNSCTCDKGKKRYCQLQSSQGRKKRG